MAIWCALNDEIKECDGKLSANRNSTSDLYARISSAQRKIESLEQTVSDKAYERWKEKDKWFWNRSDTKIDRLSREIEQAEEAKKSRQNDISDYYSRISRNSDESERIQKLRDAIERDRQMFQDYINQIMWYSNGYWTV